MGSSLTPIPHTLVNLAFFPTCPSDLERRGDLNFFQPSWFPASTVSPPLLPAPSSSALEDSSKVMFPSQPIKCFTSQSATLLRLCVADFRQRLRHYITACRRKPQGWTWAPFFLKVPWSIWPSKNSLCFFLPLGFCLILPCSQGPPLPSN